MLQELAAGERRPDWSNLNVEAKLPKKPSQIPGAICSSVLMQNYASFLSNRIHSVIADQNRLLSKEFL